jgi:hypothetical protein
MLGFGYNYGHLPTLEDLVWSTDLKDSLHSLNAFYSCCNNAFVFFAIISIIIPKIFILSMYWWSLVWTDNKAGNLDIPLNLVRVIFVKHSDPNFIELVIKVSVKCRKTN